MVTGSERQAGGRYPCRSDRSTGRRSRAPSEPRPALPIDLPARTTEPLPPGVRAPPGRAGGSARRARGPDCSITKSAPVLTRSAFPREDHGRTTGAPDDPDLCRWSNAIGFRILRAALEQHASRFAARVGRWM